jgi:hypothetical protein
MFLCLFNVLFAEAGLTLTEVVPSRSIRDVKALWIYAVTMKGTARTRDGRAHVKACITVVRACSIL